MQASNRVERYFKDWSGCNTLYYVGSTRIDLNFVIVNFNLNRQSILISKIVFHKERDCWGLRYKIKVARRK